MDGLKIGSLFFVFTGLLLYVYRDDTCIPLERGYLYGFCDILRDLYENRRALRYLESSR